MNKAGTLMDLIYTVRSSGINGDLSLCVFRFSIAWTQDRTQDIHSTFTVHSVSNNILTVQQTTHTHTYADVDRDGAETLDHTVPFQHVAS